MMTEQDVDEKTREDASDVDESVDADETALARADEPPTEAMVEGGDSALPAQLGAGRYVLAGFFACGIATAFIVSKVLVGTWNRAAENPWLARNAAFLSRLAEDDRELYTTLAGAIAGIIATVYAYRRPDVRVWTGEVASELAKVSWPSKKEVTNSTLVVIAAGTFATVFLALLDRFWGFVTNLVYGS